MHDLTLFFKTRSVSSVETTFSVDVELEPELAEFLDGDFPQMLAA